VQTVVSPYSSSVIAQVRILAFRHFLKRRLRIVGSNQFEPLQVFSARPIALAEQFPGAWIGMKIAALLLVLGGTSARLDL
jgi:hypothetical protein